MANLLQNLPNIISSTDESAFSAYNFSFDDPTIAFMQHNLSSFDAMAVAFSGVSKYDNFTKKLSKPMSIADFINKVYAIDSQVGTFLDNIAKTFNIDRSTTNIVELVWMANITNTLGNKTTQHEMNTKLSELLFSLRFSSVYKDVNPLEVRSRILEKFENDVNEDLAQQYFGMDVDQAQDYLGVAYTDNPNAKDITKWYDYRTFKEITDFDTFVIKDFNDLKLAIASPSVSACRASMTFIKTNYLSSTDPKHPGYCADELEREYKATIIYASLAHELGLGQLDESNAIGFNLLARIKNIPELMAEKNPLSRVSNLINSYEDEALSLLHSEILPEKEEKQPEQVVVEEEPVEASNASDDRLNAEEYTKKQLATFNKFIDKKRLEIVSVLDWLVKTKTTKSSFKKIEARLDSLASEYGITLITAGEEKNTKARIDANIDLIIPVVNKRFDELGRAKEIFKVVKRKMGTNLNIDDVVFDRAFLGKNVGLLTPYQEKIIRDFYKIIQADPILKSDGVYRRRTPTITAASVHERAEQAEQEPEISAVFSAFTLSPAKEAEYEEDKKIPVLINDADGDEIEEPSIY